MVIAASRGLHFGMGEWRADKLGCLDRQEVWNVRIRLLLIDIIRNLEVEGIVGLAHGGIARPGDEDLERREIGRPCGGRCGKHFGTKSRDVVLGGQE